MGLFKKKYNPLTPFGFNLVPKFKTLRFLEAVDKEADLPEENNELGDARFTKNDHNLRVWDGSEWQNQGNVVDLTWGSLEDKPTSTVQQIDDAVDHSTETGNPHETKAEEIETVESGETVQSELNKTVKSEEIRNIEVVAELPSAPDPNTLYIIEE